MEFVTIKGSPREKLGKKSARAARREGLTPCVLYGGENVIHFTTTPKELKPLVYTPEFKIAKVDMDGTITDCILKDIQFHPVTDEILHIDFLCLIPEKPIKLEIPVRFIGTSPGVKLGGTLQQTVRRIKIKTTPEHMVDHLVLDISELEMGQSIRIRDIKPSEGIEVMQVPGIPVATVEVPRSMRSAAAGEEGEELVGGETEAGEAEEEG